MKGAGRNTSPFRRSSLPRKPSAKSVTNAKVKALESARENGADETLTTNQGMRINDNQNSLKAGARGPSLLEDFILREKITHFDHERIPERVVHARGAAAHGYFQVYESLARYTKAEFLQDPARKTPVFVRFSTVAGSRGSSDLARDVRGFAVKFYTEEGNFDLVGNNIPVFFIQDAVKFPDLVHAVKPEPHNEMPQAASAHDTFWDFISLMPESMHMIMWVMSDRAIPRSFRMMEGFGVHTFRFVNERGQGALREVPLEAAARRALGAVGRGAEDLRQGPRLPPPRPVGGDRERRLPGVGARGADDRGEGRAQVRLRPARPDQDHPGGARARCSASAGSCSTATPTTSSPRPSRWPSTPATSCPGIDFTNDPLLQGRLFSYTDTQLIRLGGPELPRDPDQPPRRARPQQPARRAHAPDDQRGPDELRAEHARRRLPVPGRRARRAASSAIPERIDGTKVRARGERFFDHFSQATLFCNSQSEPEKKHIVQALRFELGKVEAAADPRAHGRDAGARGRTLADRVAEGLGLDVPAEDRAAAEPRASRRTATRRTSSRARPKKTLEAVRRRSAWRTP